MWQWIVLPTMARNLLNGTLAIEAEPLVGVVRPKTDMKQVLMVGCGALGRPVYLGAGP
jgi:hypothetical protein